MKKWMLILSVCLLFTGCGARETVETVTDVLYQQVSAQPKQIRVDLPDDAVAPVMDSTSEQVYLCNGYEIILETVAAGDLNSTIQRLSGYERDELTVMETAQDGVSRYEFVWASAGEEGDRLGQAVVLDDGAYHYCMSILRDASTTEGSQIVWRNVFSSFQLA